jgi:hypothetical protein
MEDYNKQLIIDKLNELKTKLENRKDGYVSVDADYWSFVYGLDAAIGVVEWEIHLLELDNENK